MEVGDQRSESALRITEFAWAPFPLGLSPFGIPPRHEFVTDPVPDLARPLKLGRRQAPLKEPFDIGRAEAREAPTGLAGPVSAIGLKLVHRQSPAIVAPDLRNAKFRVDLHSVQRARGDIDLDGQVGRRIPLQVQLVALPRNGRVPDIVALVRFESFFEIRPPPGGHPQRFVVGLQRLGELRDEQAQELSRLLVPLGGHADLHRPLMVGHVDAPLAHDLEHLHVVPPGNIVEDEPPSGRIESGTRLGCRCHGWHPVYSTGTAGYLKTIRIHRLADRIDVTRPRMAGPAPADPRPPMCPGRRPSAGRARSGRRGKK